MGKIAEQPILPKLTNGNVNATINGVVVPIKVGYYPSPKNATSIQWRVHVPIFEDGKLDHWQKDLLSGLTIRKLDAKTLASAKDVNATIIAKVTKQQADYQAEWDARHKTERDDLERELDEVPEKQARKIVLDTIIAAKRDPRVVKEG